MERRLLSLFAVIFAVYTVFIGISANAFASHNHFVRTSNYFLKAGTDIQPSHYEKLASYDVLILPMEAAIYNKDFFWYARKEHPTIVILAYVPTRSINIRDIDDGAGIRKKLLKGIKQDWYLRDPTGTIVQAWPETVPLNVTSDWQTYLPDFVKTTVMAQGMWDGILYDEVDAGISFLNGGSIDLDGDGIRESKDELDARWRSSVARMLFTTRELLGPQAIIVINGSSTPDYQPYVNGRIFESFPTPWEAMGRWEDSMKSYLSLSAAAITPRIFLIQADSGNTGRNDIYQKMRFALSSALLGDGYFGFDFGTQNHGQMWWYDEYDVRLGRPSTAAYRTSSASSAIIHPDVWRRDFQNGTVLVNSTETIKEISFDGEFEKIRGVQDPHVNDGSIISSISISPSDGIILLRPLSTIQNAAYQNGSFARVFDGSGNSKRNGFFAYNSSLRGSVTVLTPPQQSGILYISAEKGIITVTDKSNRIHTFRPFDSWNGELNIALDTSSSSSPLLYASREYGSYDFFPKRTGKLPESMISIFEISGKFVKSFSPLGPSYTGSLRFALGDLNNDGLQELVLSTGAGTAPIIRIYDKNGKILSGGFLAYQKTFRGGVFVGIADTKGDGKGMIITSPGSSGAPHIRIFDGKARAVSPGFLAFSSSNRAGIRVVGADIDGDGKDEIVATTMKVFTYAAKH